MGLTKETENSVFKRGTVAYINRLERMILMHSYLYYELDKNVVSDHFFDQISKDLADCIVEFPEQFKASEHPNVFSNFDGSTGAGLDYNRWEITSMAHHLFNLK